MKALSVKQPHAGWLASGAKGIETRTWKTSYRGPLLICSSKKPSDQGAAGIALAVVKLVDCRPMVPGDVAVAMCDYATGRWAWIVDWCYRVPPVPVRGQLRIFETDALADHYHWVCDVCEGPVIATGNSIRLCVGGKERSEYACTVCGRTCV